MVDARPDLVQLFYDDLWNRGDDTLVPAVSSGPLGYRIATPDWSLDTAGVSIPAFAEPPTWSADLVAEVDRAFAGVGAATPGWPDPHPHADRSPLEEEYSRVLDPGKYRILDARVEAWVQVLETRGVASTQDLPPEEQDWQGAVRKPTDLARVRAVRPERPGGLTLLLATTLVHGSPFGLDVAVADAAGRAAQLDTVPSCGCDACDSGSAELLEAVDGWVLTVASGGVVHARDFGGHITRMFSGWSAQGDNLRPGWEGDRWLDESVEVPDGVRRWIGEPWL